MRGLTFRIGDIPVRVDATFWIIMGLFGLQRAAVSDSFDVVLVVEWVAAVFIGILVHELGHAVSFRAFGRSPSVTLYGLGGLTSASGGLTPGKRLVTTLAGPGVGFALGALVIIAQRTGLWSLPRLDGYGVTELLGLGFSAPFIRDITVPELVFLDLVFINIGWGVLNLVPLHPLDGGQSLEAGLGLLRVKQAARITSAVGVVVAAAAGVWAARNGQIFLLLIMVFLGMSNVRRLGFGGGARSARQTSRQAPGFSAELQHTMQMADQALQQGRADEAVEMLRQEHEYRPSPASARVYLAVLARTRRYDELEQAAAGMEGLDADALGGVAAALVAGGRYEAGLRAAEEAWSAAPDDVWEPAVTAAAARAGLRDVDGALRWLFTAADRGWDDRRRLDSDPVFAEVRSDPRMGELYSRMGV